MSKGKKNIFVGYDILLKNILFNCSALHRIFWAFLKFRTIGRLQRESNI